MCVFQRIAQVKLQLIQTKGDLRERHSDDTIRTGQKAKADSAQETQEWYLRRTSRADQNKSNMIFYSQRVPLTHTSNDEGEEAEHELTYPGGGVQPIPIIQLRAVCSELQLRVPCHHRLTLGAGNWGALVFATTTAGDVCRVNE